MTRRTPRVRAIVCLLGLVAIAVPAGRPAARQPDSGSAPQQPAGTPPDSQVFRAGTDAVLVDVYPHRDGRIIEGLTADQFELFEDGKPQRIESFEFVRLDGGPGDTARRDPGSMREMREQAADPHSRVFVVYLDRGHTTVEGSNVIRRPLVDMLNRAVGPQDLFGVMTTGMRPTDVTLGRRTLTIEDQLAVYWTWGQRQRITDDRTDPMEAQLTRCFDVRQIPLPPPNQHYSEASEPWILDDGVARRTLDQMIIERRREDRAITGLEQLVVWLGELREARSVVVVITDGWLLFDRAQHLEAEPARDARFYRAFPKPGDRMLSTPVGPRPRDPEEVVSGEEFAACVAELNRLVSSDGDQRLRDLIQVANRNNVSFYPVSAAGLQAFDTHIGDRTKTADNLPDAALTMRGMLRIQDRVTNLRTVAEATDGIAVVQSNDLTGGMRRIVEDVSAYYLLTYVSTNKALDGRYRRIEVKLKTPDASLRARRGYTAARADELAARAGEAAGPPPLAPGIAEALGALERLRPAAQAFARGTVAGGTLHLAVELPGGPGAPRWAEGTTVTATVATDSGTVVGTTTAPLDTSWRSAALSLPAPTEPAPWRVTITVGRGIDRLQEQIIVAPGDGTVLGDPRIFRARPSPRAPLRLAATPQFTRAERLRVEWPRVVAIDRRDARLLDARGQPLGAPVLVSDLAEPNAAVTVDLPLGPLASGDYLIELSASAGAETVLKYVAFRITQ